MRELLEMQANRIELVLASHKIPSRVVGGTVTPRSVRFELAMRMDTRLAQLKGLSEEIALSLQAPSCRVVRDNGALNIEIPRSEPVQVGLLKLCRRLAYAPPCSPVLGLDDKGTPLLLNLPSPDIAHALVCGTTGSGKTALARAMALSLALHNPQRQLQLVLIDPKGRGFVALAGLPHLVCPPVTSVPESLQRLAWLVGEMERRDREGIREPRLVVFVDELADLLMMGGKEMEMAVTRLSQRGREAGVHLVACTQKPTVAVIGSLTKANFPVRIVGSVTSPEEARVAAGIAGTGAERLQGRGDFLLVHKGQTTRFAAAYVSSDEAQAEVSRLHGPQPARAQPSHSVMATGTPYAVVASAAKPSPGSCQRAPVLRRIK
jgi:S-DNA-T family DNA segregation ATPase FtsK/SpoIIIE